MAKAKGAEVKTDSVIVRDTVITKAVEIDTVFQLGIIDFDSLRNANPDQWPDVLPCPELPPVMEAKKGKASLKLTQTDKGLQAQIECKSDTVYLEKKVLVPVSLEAGYTATRVALITGAVGLILLVAGFVLGRLSKR